MDLAVRPDSLAQGFVCSSIAIQMPDVPDREAHVPMEFVGVLPAEVEVAVGPVLRESEGDAGRKPLVVAW